MSFDLTNKNISDTFQNLLQKTGSDGRLYDLVGNQVRDLTIDGTLTANTYITSQSIVNTSSGSTAFGDSADDSHHFSGSITASGNISSSETIYADTYYQNGKSAIITSNDKMTFGRNIGDVAIGKNPTQTTLTIDAHVTASGNISASGDLISNDLFIDNGITHNGDTDTKIIFSDNTVRVNAGNIVNTNFYSYGTHFALPITASGNISSSALVYGTQGRFSSRVVTPQFSEWTAGAGHLFNHNITASGNISSSGNLHVNGITASSDIHVGQYIKHLGDEGTHINFSDNQISIKAGGTTLANFVQGSPTLIRFIPDVLIGSISGNPGEALEVIGNISASGNLSANNITASGDITASGNLLLTGGHIIAKNPDGGGGSHTLLRTSGDGTTNKVELGDSEGENNGTTLTVDDGNELITTNKPFDITNTTDATNATGDTGALRVEGGASIAKKVFVGTDLNVGGSTITSHITASGNISGSLNKTGSFGSIHTAGDVGIGTTSPGKSLEVIGHISASGDVYANQYYTDGNLALDLNNNTTRVGANNSSTGVLLGKAGTNTKVTMIGNVTASGNISSSGTITAEQLTTSDDLTVGDDIIMSDGGKIIDSAGNDDTITFDQTNRKIQAHIDGGIQLTIGNDKVGIRTANPTVEGLQVEGVISASGKYFEGLHHLINAGDTGSHFVTNADTGSAAIGTHLVRNSITASNLVINSDTGSAAIGAHLVRNSTTGSAAIGAHLVRNSITESFLVTNTDTSSMGNLTVAGNISASGALTLGTKTDDIGYYLSSSNGNVEISGSGDAILNIDGIITSSGKHFEGLHHLVNTSATASLIPTNAITQSILVENSNTASILTRNSITQSLLVENTATSSLVITQLSASSAVFTGIKTGAFVSSSNGNLEISGSGRGQLEVDYRLFDTGSSHLGSAGGGVGDIVKFGGTTTTAGAVYYLTSAGGWATTDADAGGTTSGSIAVALGTNSTNAGMLLRGVAKLDHDPGGLVGAPIYLSTAAGRVQNSPPGSGDFARVIGYNLDDAGLIYFNPDNTTIKVA
tara:strand:+ start:201 stop:3323 length:3123 start_codon:yes stop_codon:yes gene_type:complete